MRNKVIFYIAVLFLIGSLLFLSYAWIDETSITIDEGLHSIQSDSLQSENLVILNGEWRYYDEVFLVSDQIRYEERQVGYDYVSLPCRYERFDGNEVSSEGYGTLSLELDLPDEVERYGLDIEYIATAYRVFVDGVLITEVGKVGTNTSNSRGIYAPSQVYFVAKDHVRLDIEFSNFDDAITYLQPIKFGKWKIVERNSKLKVIHDLTSIFIVFSVGLIIMSFYIFRMTEQIPFYFSIFAFLIAIRSLTINQRILQQVVPDLSWGLFIRLVFVPLVLGLYFYVHFMKARVPYALSHKWVKFTSVISLFFTVVALVTINNDICNFYLTVVVICYILTTIIGIIRLVRNIRQGGNEYLLCGALIMVLAVMINDAVADFLPYKLIYLSSMAFSLFFIFEGVELSQYFAVALNKAEVVSEENKNLVEQLMIMNDSLESTVVERTRELEVSNSKLVELNKRLETLSYVDELTRIPNRRFFFSEVGRQFHEAKQENPPIAMFIMDIDYFKTYNDFYGHAKGDWCLFNVAQAIQTLAEDNGLLAARYGGEEFIVAGFGLKREFAVSFGEALREVVEELQIEHAKSEASDYVTLSVGCVYKSLETVETLMETVDQADNMLYQAKASGRNAFFI